MGEAARGGTGPLDTTFTETVVKSPNQGGWTYLVWPDSASFFGTGGRVKVTGTMDGEPFQTSFMALGDGNHKLPVTGALLKKVGKGVGDPITVRLTERLG